MLNSVMFGVSRHSITHQENPTTVPEVEQVKHQSNGVSTNGKLIHIKE